MGQHCCLALMLIIFKQNVFSLGWRLNNYLSYEDMKDNFGCAMVAHI